MKRNVIALFVATATLFATGVITTSAQTAGGSTLEQISYLLKDSYRFGFNKTGTSLTLRNEFTGRTGITLDMEYEFVMMHIKLGNLSSLSKANRKSAHQKISDLNTRLPMGTLVVGNGGEVVIEHHLNTYYAKPTEIATMVSRFVKEAAMYRTVLFS